MIRGLLLGILACLVGLVAIVLIRTFTFGGAVGADRIALPETPVIDTDMAAGRLSDVLQIRTITLQAGDPLPGREGPWRELEAYLEASYPAFHRAASKTHIADLTLLYEWQGSNPDLDPILLMAHQDVVPVNIGTEDDWTAPPFAGRIVDGHVYGRGTLDNKASLIAIMEAAEALASTGYQPERTVFIMLGHDEEVSGSGARAGVAYLKERGLRMEMVLDEGFVVVDPFPLTGTPVGMIGVSEKGYVTIRLTSEAAGGHSSQPPRNSANVQLSRAIVELEENQMPADFSRPPVSEMIQATASDMPFLQRMAFANVWLFRGMLEKEFAKTGAANAIIRTTTAPTMLQGSIKENVLPQKSTALVNFRVHPNDSPDSVLAHVRDVIGDLEGVSADFDETGGISSSASPVSPTDNRAYQVLASVATETGDGAPAAPGLVIGATDARWTVEISDNVYRFAPSVIPIEDLNGFHGTNERISVENVGRLARGYAQIIKAMTSEAR